MQSLQSFIQQQELNNLSTFLTQSLQGINTSSNYATFKQLEQKPQSYLYFLALLISPQYKDDLRQLAGVTFKNMIKKNIDNLSKQIIDLIKGVVFEQYDLQTGKVLKTLGSIMGVIVQKIRFEEDTLNFLLSKAKLGNVSAIESLKRIIEDFRFDQQNANMIVSEQFANLSKKLVEILIPQCYTNTKQYAIDCFNMMIYPMPISLIESLKEFIKVLKIQISNQNPNVCLAVMQGFEAIVSTRKDLIDREIIELIASKNFTDEKLRKVQANFWIQALDSDNEELLKPVLNQVLPKLILNLVLTNQDIANIMQTKQTLQRDEQLMGENQTNDDDEQQQTAKGGDYTLRKRCYLLISKLSAVYFEQFWDLSKAYVTELIKTNDWMKHEVAILFIGIIAENCQEAMNPNIRQIIQIISSTMIKSNQHLLKSTCLWTLSQHTKSIVKLAENDQNTITNYVNLILEGLKDQRNNVKSASCTSLGNLVQELQGKIINWSESILAVTSQALLNYKGSSLYSLFQFYAVFVESIPQQNYSKTLIDQILIPLCHKWSSLDNSDTDICPLVQCLVTTCEMGKQHISTYVMQLFNKAVSIFNPKNKQIFLRNIDLIEVLIGIASPENKQIILKSGITQKSLQLVSGSDHEIKQTCFSLLSVIVEHIGINNPDKVMKHILDSMNKKKQSQINNGLFCIIEIIMKYPQAIQQINQITKLAVERFTNQSTGAQNTKTSTHFLINYAKIVCTIALYHTQTVAPYFKQIFVSLCLTLKSSNEHNRRYHIAIAGLLRLIQLRSEDIIQNFKYIVDLGICMKNPPIQNKQALVQMIKLYIQNMGINKWEKIINDPYFLPGAVNKINALLAQ